MAECNTPESFWAQVVVTPDSDSCWLWAKKLPKSQRYPHIRIGNRRRVKAHRHAWALAHGGIPKDLQVLHKCDVPTCCRPSHLFLGTHADNMADKKRKGRVVVPIGEANHLAKLKAAQVVAIRNEYAAGASQAEIAHRHDVGQTQVSRIVRGKAWAAAGGVIHPTKPVGRKTANQRSPQ